MKLKLSLLALTMTAASTTCLAFTANPPKKVTTAQQTSIESIESITLSSMTKWALNQALSGLKSKASSVLKDAIFGTSSKTYVDLSQESLNAIEGIVERQLDNMVRSSMLAELDALQENVYAYHDRVNVDEFAPGLSTDRSLLITGANALYTNQVFNSNFSDYHLLTSNYAQAIMLRYSIIAERASVRPQEHSYDYLASQASAMLDNLIAMGNATSSYINSNVYISSTRSYNCNVHSICYDYTVRDKIKGSHSYYRYDQ